MYLKSRTSLFTSSQKNKSFILISSKWTKLHQSKILLVTCHFFYDAVKTYLEQHVLKNANSFGNTNNKISALFISINICAVVNKAVISTQIPCCWRTKMIASIIQSYSGRSELYFLLQGYNFIGGNGSKLNYCRDSYYCLLIVYQPLYVS